MKTIFLSFSIANSSVSDYFITLSNKLSEESRVIIITDTFSDRHISILPEIEILSWPSRRPTKWKDFLFLIQKVREYKPDMMIALFGAVNLFLLVGSLLGVKNRIAWSRTISAQFPSHRGLQLRKKYIYRLATKIFANSNATKLDLVQNFGVRESKIQVVYNAVKEWNPGIKKVEENKVVYVGRFHYSKGISTLLDAMPLVLQEFPKTELVLIGGNLEGEEVKQLKKKAAALNLQNITFLGNQPKEKVLTEFSTACISVVPSLVEAFGFVVIESFSVRTPVVGSDTSGIAEIIRDGKDGFLFEPGNAKELSEKILRLLQDRRLREGFNKNCYERFKNCFELENSTDKLSLQLKDMLTS